MTGLMSRFALATALIAAAGSAAAHVSLIPHAHPHAHPTWTALPGLDVLVLGVAVVALGAGWLARRRRLK